MNTTEIIDLMPYLPEYKVVAECESCDHICYMVVPKALSSKAMFCPECGDRDLWVTRALGRRIRKMRYNQ